MSVHLPAGEQVQELFAELLDRDVRLEPGSPVVPGPAVPATVATYVDDQDCVRAVISCDLALSARAGAAIGLVPSSGADRAIRSGCVDGVLVDNLAEVLDVAASLFDGNHGTHVRLQGLHAAGHDLPGDVLARALTLGRRADVRLEIAGYGDGRLSVVLVERPGSGDHKSQRR
jgi:hypothetical protein